MLFTEIAQTWVVQRDNVNTTIIHIVDSGASNHMTSHEDWFQKLHAPERPGYVETGDDTTHPIQHIGNVPVEIQAQHRPSRLKKPRTESVWTDRLGRVPSRLGPIGDAKKDIP